MMNEQDVNSRKVGRPKTHGMTNTRIYVIWRTMMQRTGVYKCSSHLLLQYYASKKISVCEEWHDFETFFQWSKDSGYQEDLELDRIDNNGGYSPENCRWVTRSQNMRNTRRAIKLPDGTPFLDIMDRLNITDNNKRSKYTKFYRRKHQIHPELKEMMSEYVL